MKKLSTAITKFMVSIIAASLLAGCGSSDASSSLTDKYGNPVEVTIRQVDHIDEPEDFDERHRFVNPEFDEDKKMIFDAKPGESINIINPSTEAISAEDVAKMVTIEDGFAEEDSSVLPASLLRKAAGVSNKKAFKIADPYSKKPIRTIAPHAKAALLLDEPTRGGELTVYSKEEGSPLNFEDKSPSVNELIVATSRPEVENYDPNSQVLGLLYSKVVDMGTLDSKIEGNFVYRESVPLQEGDQFFIGDSETLDASATFFSFLSQAPVSNGYLIQYTVPDYSVCYNAFDVHKQNEPLNLEDERVEFTAPTEEELLRELDEDGGFIDIYENEVLPNLLMNDEELMSQLMPKGAWNMNASFSLIFDRLSISAGMEFSVSGSSFFISFNLSVSGKIVDEANKDSPIGSGWITGGVSIYVKKTYSTYMDFSISMAPYPKLKYVVAQKTLDETSVSFSIGISAAMKKYDLNQDIAEQKSNLDNVLANAAPIGDVPDAAVMVETLDNGNKLFAIEPKNKPDYNADEKKYDGLRGFDRDKTGKYVGNGLVIAGPGFHFPVTPYVTIEMGISVFFTPTIEGRLFISYTKVSESIVCKVNKGFEIPEGYSDSVEYSHSYWTIGVYVRLGLEAGFIFETIIYPTGCKKIFMVNIAFTIGLYFMVKGVAMMYWGDDVDFSVMGYVSIEFGFLFRINIRAIGLDGVIMLDLMAWSFKYPIFAFGTNLHFLDWVSKEDELDFSSGHYININDLGILELIYFSTDSMNVHRGVFSWDFETYFASAVVPIKLDLFDDLTITEGKDYVKFNDKLGCFEVEDSAPAMFDFKFKVSINRWLGVGVSDKTFTVHFLSSKFRAISFEGYEQGPSELPGGIHLGGGMLEQGAVYQAPAMPSKDGQPFFGWLGNNGLYLQPGEQMTVGATSITFKPLWRAPVTYTVNFFDGNNNLISSQKIASGGSAVEPSPEVRDAKMGGKTFIGWDRKFDDVHSNFNVYGIYAEGGAR